MQAITKRCPYLRNIPQDIQGDPGHGWPWPSIAEVSYHGLAGASYAVPATLTNAKNPHGAHMRPIQGPYDGHMAVSRLYSSHALRSRLHQDTERRNIFRPYCHSHMYGRPYGWKMFLCVLVVPGYHYHQVMMTETKVKLPYQQMFDGIH